MLSKIEEGPAAYRRVLRTKRNLSGRWKIMISTDTYFKNLPLSGILKARMLHSSHFSVKILAVKWHLQVACSHFILDDTNFCTQESKNIFNQVYLNLRGTFENSKFCASAKSDKTARTAQTQNEIDARASSGKRKFRCQRRFLRVGRIRRDIENR